MLELLAVVSTLLGALASEPPRSEPPPLVVTNARVLDATGDSWLSGRSVLIDHGRIASIADAAAVHIPDGAQTIDATGLYLIPGLIDLHTHLLLHPYNEASWNDQVLKES